MARTAKKKPKPEFSHMELHKTDAENPLFSASHDVSRTNPKRIPVVVNVRESAITMLASKGAINAAQAAAANKFRRYWETLGGKGAGAMDYSRVVVDGGPTPDPISSAALMAGAELNRAFKAIKAAHGVEGYKLIVRVVGEGYSIHDLCQTRRERDTLTDRLRLCLDVLAVHWSFMNNVHRS